MDKEINELKQLIEQYKYDELSLRDLEYLDEQFEDIIENIRELKNNIVDNRFRKAFDDFKEF